MLTFLTTVLVGAVIQVGVIFTPRRPILPPRRPPGIAMSAHPVPDERQVGPQRHSVGTQAQSRTNASNVHPSEHTLMPIPSPSFPLAALPCAPGVYALVNRETGCVYIGESVNILQRLRSHRSMLERGSHFCQSLQADFNAFGVESFDVTILTQGPEYQSKEARTKQEKIYITGLPAEKRYNLVDRRGERNSFSGKTHSVEFRERLSAARKGIPNTTLGRPISIPPFRTRKGNMHEGGTFASIAEASRVTGMARRDIRSRLNNPLFPDWREIGP